MLRATLNKILRATARVSTYFLLCALLRCADKETDVPFHVFKRHLKPPPRYVRLGVFREETRVGCSITVIKIKYHGVFGIIVLDIQAHLRILSVTF